MSVRWSKAIDAGLDHIYALATCELENHELSQLECRCGCTACNADLTDKPCKCEGKPPEKLCSGCLATYEWGEALRWLGSELNRRRRK
jgi:hypothetical protein